jgi:hypothetical protein
MTNNIDDKSLKPLRLLKGTFTLPRYQRGYRWTEVQVKDLLDDLFTFVGDKTKDEKAFYFLQPLVVCKSFQNSRDTRDSQDSQDSQNSQDSYEVIDGQQRLITIRLIDAAICKFEKRQSRLRFKLRFESRPESEKLLNELTENFGENLSPDIEEGIEQYYIKQAALTINEYISNLKNPDEDLELFYLKFTRNVDFLWHVVDYADSSESAKHFIRLNMGRISLTSAELCRAILLNPANHNLNKEVDKLPALLENNSYDNDVQNKLNAQLLYRRQILLGNQWDNLERGLRKPEFWAFLGSDEQDQRETRIDILLDLYTNTFNRSDNFETFHKLENLLLDKETKKYAREIWDEITLIYKTLASWYENHDYYHWIGYLINQGGNAIKSMHDFLEDAKILPKPLFKDKILEKINASVTLDGKLEDLDYTASKDRETIAKILFLFNVEYTRQMRMYGNSNLADEYKQRFAFGLHKRESTWSLEHIEAQNVESFNDRKHWNLWIKDHQKALLDLKPRIGQYHGVPNKDKILDDIDGIDKKCEKFIKDKNNTKEEYLRLSEEILTVVKKLDPIFDTSDKKDDFMNGIVNLALIDKKLNSHLNNSIFLVKQEKIMKIINRGEYLPKSIEAIFMRYFNDKPIFLPYWSKEDRTNYIKKIRKTLKPFLTEKD